MSIIGNIFLGGSIISGIGAVVLFFVEKVRKRHG